MVNAINKVNQKNQYPASLLPSTIERVQSFNYQYNKEGRPYYMKMGKQIFVTDTVQDKLEHYNEVEQLIFSVDSIIKPVFGKGILQFSKDELIMYDALQYFDSNKNTSN